MGMANQRGLGRRVWVLEGLLGGGLCPRFRMFRNQPYTSEGPPLLLPPHRFGGIYRTGWVCSEASTVYRIQTRVRCDGPGLRVLIQPHHLGNHNPSGNTSRTEVRAELTCHNMTRVLWQTSKWKLGRKGDPTFYSSRQNRPSLC